MNNKRLCLKVALLSNFTIKGLKQEIEKKCKEALINIEVYQGGYGQINQEFINEKSSLKQFNPDITFLLINNKFALEQDEINIIQDKEQRVDYLNSKISEFIETINLFLKNISGVLVTSNLKENSYSPLGINEDKIDFSLKDWPGYFNKKIKSEFIKESRVRIYDFNSFFIRFGENNIINDKLRYLGDIYIHPDYLLHLSNDLMAYLKAFASRNRKCIVLDLDNTLWGGIIGEDGFNNIKLDSKPPGNSFLEFQKYLLALHKKGIILAINSNNNFEDAMKVIREHPSMVLKKEHFACIKINWQDKVSNMTEIAQEINIGFDSFVFIDDDPLNRALIKESLPEILVVDLPGDSALYVKTLKELNDFDAFQLTEEDFKKGEIYYQQKQRKELKTKIRNIDDFLKKLNMEVEISKASDFTIPRISQLTKKTNQFNLTSERYTEEDIKEFSQNPNFEVFSVAVKDKFGDNGLSGVFIVKRDKERLIIDTFLLSCRVIGRNIEKVMLNRIFELAEKENASKVIGLYYSTERNAQTKSFYLNNGFDEISESEFEMRNSNFDRIKKIDYIRTS